jgi:hypothetical protein
MVPVVRDLRGGQLDWRVGGLQVAEHGHGVRHDPLLVRQWRHAQGRATVPKAQGSVGQRSNMLCAAGMG